MSTSVCRVHGCPVQNSSTNLHAVGSEEGGGANRVSPRNRVLDGGQDQTNPFAS